MERALQRIATTGIMDGGDISGRFDKDQVTEVKTSTKLGSGSCYGSMVGLMEEIKKRNGKQSNIRLPLPCWNRACPVIRLWAPLLSDQRYV
jgi:hypothetical protein